MYQQWKWQSLQLFIAASQENLSSCEEKLNTSEHMILVFSPGQETPHCQEAGKEIEWIVLTSNRVDGPYTWPMQYQVPVTSFFWNGSEGIQHPLYQQQHFSLCFTSACLEFTLAESCFEPTHQHKQNLNTAVSVCKVYLRDIFSIMKHSSSCINVSLRHKNCG